MSTLRLKLADGTEIEGALEGAISGQLRDLLTTGYAGNKMRIAADESEDVEGHALASTVRLRLFDEDDVEGHALSLRLPNADAARELQRRLLAAGVVGVIVVGAVTTSIYVADQGASTGSGTQAAPAREVPAPAVHPGIAAEIKGGDLAPAQATTPDVPAPAVHPGIAAEIKGGDLAPAQATTPDVPAPAVHPGIAAEIKGGDLATTESADSGDPADDFVGRPGEPRAQ